LRAIASDPDVVLAANSRRLPMTAVFSGRTAGWLHGLDLPPCDPVEVTLPSGSPTSRLAGIVVRRSDVGVSETVMRRGYRTTSVVRTLADLGRRLPLVEAVAALDTALHKRLLKSDDLRSWACAHPQYPGIGRLRRTIGLAEPATESVMETRLRLLLVTAGLPRPQAQVSYTTKPANSWGGQTSTTHFTALRWSTTVRSTAKTWLATTGVRIDWSMRATACCASQQRMCCPLPIRSWPS